MIVESIVCIELEQENFAEIGCYFYRASLAIMELQTTENTPENAMDILQSLSSRVDVAKNLVKKCRRGTNPNSDSELGSTISQLEGVIKQMGECLNLIPSSTFQNQEYAEVAVQSLSNEMQGAHFEVSQAQVLETKELEPQKAFSKEEPKEETEPEESDLYSVNVEVSTDNSQVLGMPHFIELLKNTSLSSHRKHSNRTSSSKSLPQMVEYIEPLYETFYCPLTKQVMDDPVTIESGVTYERKAIADWFEEFETSQDIFCPTTGQKLLNRVLRTNVALKTTIDEWKERNEAARIKVCRAALTLATSANMVLEAIRDLQYICKMKCYNKMQVRNAGVLPLLVKFLEYKDRNVRCAALELLRQLAEGDDDGKVQLFFSPEFLWNHGCCHIEMKKIKYKCLYEYLCTHAYTHENFVQRNLV